MRMRSTIIAVSLALAAMLPLTGCGDNDNDFDGNDNTPNATRTPTPAARTSTPAQPTSTPVATNQPTATAGAGPTVTPTESGATATPTEGATSPTATATPGSGPACTSGEHVMVDAALDKAFAAFAITVAYPTTSVNIPGSGNAVGNRVTFAVTGGLSTVSDDDDQGGDGVDDTLHASFVSGVDNAPGKVFTITFDCLEGQPKPAAGAFDCTVVSASTSGADTIPDEVCTLTVR